MNENNTLRIITLRDLGSIFVQRIAFIILAGIIALVASLTISNMSYTPKYQSTATLYILRENEGMSTSSGEANNEFTLALKVVNDCTYLLKSRTVVEQVIDELGLGVTYKEMYGMISTSNPTNTRILEVTVTANTPESAKVIVDRLCEVGERCITEAMGFDQVNLYEYGALETTPSNEISTLTHLIVAIAIAAMVYIIFVLAFILDDRIRSHEDIERILGLSILGDIPNIGGNGKSKYGKRSPYGYGYGYGHAYGGKRYSADNGGSGAEKEKRS